jgi:hypothetical protein
MIYLSILLFFINFNIEVSLSWQRSPYHHHIIKLGKYIIIFHDLYIKSYFQKIY